MSRKNGAKNNHYGARFLAILIVGILLACSVFFFNDKMNSLLGLGKVEGNSFNGSSSSEIASKVEKGDLSIHFLDVGQADACIIEFPDDKTMIIDGGDVDAKDTVLNYIDANVKTDDGKTIEYFDYAILTHSDSDHCGSLDDVLNKYPAKTFYRPNVIASRKGYTDPDISLMTADAASKDTVAYKNCIEKAHATNATKEKYNITTDIIINDYTVDDINSALEPTNPEYYSFRFYGPNNTVYKDWNDYSPIMVLYYGDEKFVLTGDCEKKGESEFVAKVNKGEGKFADFDSSFNACLYKLGHHGSRTSSSEDFLNVITKKAFRPDTLLIISCGKDNKYGHPHKEVIDRLLNMGFKSENILRTYEQGNILVLAKCNQENGVKNTTLMYGANEVQSPCEGGGQMGGFTLQWWHIALGIFVVFTLVILLLPHKKKIKKIANEVDDIMDDVERASKRRNKRR